MDLFLYKLYVNKWLCQQSEAEAAFQNMCFVSFSLESSFLNCEPVLQYKI